ncbi:diacylglycerol kinase family lipid kinase [Candidatus Aminicenantes bacterium AC-335-B20]|jgi:YegS/Rv2252/BmrU family lipid kinase|nr:diacylglycerol kinase family lipid kinase [SCandidatus Aminicenantes bacterium Aminicenantia_JdfR_composite]MCP2597639.1 diacylglycerol kinase family lipid kinase [Candidatus Aminicenantes bacterium AC-335-G13]MCP2599171.1 diacylglycerol kinase family lipid kinase [Candidatus Aminicenantes bacterium AC-335-B20]MCP2605520.1 diacylglycerol kinase family lipid kinase [Candidatus Aminicenantes bacterium AC-335-O07]MCP2619148.1 diacylglycerol kinase family lipid kinase [Candidatus Aminicenantes b
MKKKEEKVLVVINPKAGVGNKLKFHKILKKELHSYFKIVEIVMTRKKGDGFEYANKGKEDFDLIVACGGDGTINEIGSALINSGTTLGIIPLGSGNGLARGLKIPIGSVKKAAQVLFKGVDINIDAGRIANHYFFNVAGIGLDAQIARDFNYHDVRGIAPYIFYAVKNFLTNPPIECTIINDKKEILKDILILAFANFKEYGGKAIIAPSAKPDDGLLDICILKKPNFFVALYHLPNLFLGRINKLPYYYSFQANSLHIKGKTPLLFHYDGEKGEELTEVNISVLPRALKVRVITPL